MKRKTATVRPFCAPQRHSLRDPLALGELPLEGRKLRAQRLYRQCIDVELARGRALAAGDFVHLRHAFDEIGEQLLVHKLPHRPCAAR